MSNDLERNESVAKTSLLAHCRSIERGPTHPTVGVHPIHR